MVTPAPVPAAAGAAPSAPTTTDLNLGAIAWSALAAVSALVSANHGYRRNGKSYGWAAVWGVAGAVAPVLTPIAALYQGYGEESTDVRVKHLEEAVIGDRNSWKPRD